MIFLKVNNINKVFKKKNVLKNISIEFKTGKIYGLIGKNGAGKSTLMKILLNLESYEFGTIEFSRIDNSPISKAGLIENSALYPFLNATQNMKRYNAFFKNKINKKQISYYLKIVGLDNSKKKVKHFSLGMKQRLGLAQAFSVQPDFLILDEPFNGLDPEIIINIKKYLQKLKSQGKCILISSHQLNELDKLCDEISMLKEGELLTNINENTFGNLTTYKIETSNNIATRAIFRANNINVLKTTEKYVFVELPKEQINDVLKKLIFTNIYIYNVIRSKKDLEEIFLEYNK